MAVISIIDEPGAGVGDGTTEVAMMVCDVVAVVLVVVAVVLVVGKADCVIGSGVGAPNNYP